LLQAGAAAGVPGFTITQSGPTYDQQPPFDWGTSTLAPYVPHAGQPQLWKFPWLTMTWNTSAALLP
jgi:hypothetical protein